MWWLINIYMFFASCVKGITQVWNLIIVRKFKEDITKIVTSMDWCGLNKDISNLFAIPSYGI